VIRFEEMKVERRLGEGSYAKVELCFDRGSGERVAVKVYGQNVTREGHRMANVRREIAVLKRLDHPGVIKLKSAATERSKVYLIM
jgi:serine/threonine protein kinase